MMAKKVANKIGHKNLTKQTYNKLKLKYNAEFGGSEGKVVGLF